MSRAIVPDHNGSLQAPQLAAIYARVSTTDQADKGYSLPTQIEACQLLAGRHGYTVPGTHIFVDDYTGTSLNRPQFKQLRDLVRQRLVQAVFVYDLDRLSRKLAHQLLLSEECEQVGVALRIVTMPDSAKTPEAQLLTSAEGELARLDDQQRLIEQTEIETKSLMDYCARVRQALQRFTLEEKRRALEALNITGVWHPNKPLEIQGSIQEVIDNHAIRRPYVPAGDRNSVRSPGQSAGFGGNGKRRRPFGDWGT